MAIETAGVGAGIKFLGIPVVAGSVATALAFMIMWPRTLREAFIRLACAILTSVFAGPFLVIAVHSWWPGLFTSAKDVAIISGTDPALGVLFVAAPVLLAAALPAWWVIGAVVRWFDRRNGKDIGELAHDAAVAVKDVRSSL
jgi:hypothetical protein